MKCQDCRNHSNKPSYCKEIGEYVPRKKEDCPVPEKARPKKKK